MRYCLILIFGLSTVLCKSQSLGKERVDKLNKTVVKIKIKVAEKEFVKNGTGFVVSKNGLILTSFHVVRDILFQDTISNTIKISNPIYVEFVNGDFFEVGIHNYILGTGLQNAIAYDYCVLVPLQTKQFEYLKLGDWNEINVGDEVYSSGYPLDIEENLFTKGIVSAKFIQSQKELGLPSRNVAYLDLTMNGGNSGGPILKIGETYKDDVVIGIATFGSTPFSKELQELYSYAIEMNETNSGFTMTDNKGIRSNSFEIAAKLAIAFSRVSLGINACVSIQYPSDVLPKD